MIRKKKKDKKEKNVDPMLLGVILVLMIFGLIAVSSASTVLSYERFGNNNHYFFLQGIFVAVGLILMFIVSKIDYHFWQKWSQWILLGVLGMLAAVIVPGVGFRVGSAVRWINTGFFLIQPSEFVKLAIVFYLSAWFASKEGAEHNFWFGILPPLVVSGLAVGLIVVEPDVGTAAMLAVVILVVLFAAGVSWRYVFGLLLSGFAALWILVKAAPYRAARIISFLDPSTDPQGIGYHITQALLAIGSGGLWGYGFGLSRQKHNYLPEAIGDSIFAVMAEELGFVRILFLVLAFLLLGFLGMRVAAKAPDRFGQLVAVGITGWIFFQALINIGAITKLLPLTGISLPFISYGGSSMLALSVAAGVFLNISRHRV